MAINYNRLGNRGFFKRKFYHTDIFFSHRMIRNCTFDYIIFCFHIFLNKRCRFLRRSKHHNIEIWITLPVPHLGARQQSLTISPRILRVRWNWANQFHSPSSRDKRLHISAYVGDVDTGALDRIFCALKQMFTYVKLK